MNSENPTQTYAPASPTLRRAGDAPYRPWYVQRATASNARAPLANITVYAHPYAFTPNNEPLFLQYGTAAAEEAARFSHTLGGWHAEDARYGRYEQQRGGGGYDYYGPNGYESYHGRGGHASYDNGYGNTGQAHGQYEHRAVTGGEYVNGGRVHGANGAEVVEGKEERTQENRAGHGSSAVGYDPENTGYDGRYGLQAGEQKGAGHKDDETKSGDLEEREGSSDEDRNEKLPVTRACRDFDELEGNETKRMTRQDGVQQNSKDKTSVDGTDMGYERVSRRWTDGSRSEDRGDGSSGGRASKRTRLNWTESLHTAFLKAVEKIGIDNAVPTTIMKEMGEGGLTRENVASHLQKYRGMLKKEKEEEERRLLLKAVRKSAEKGGARREGLTDEEVLEFVAERESGGGSRGGVGRGNVVGRDGRRR